MECLMRHKLNSNTIQFTMIPEQFKNEYNYDDGQNYVALFMVKGSPPPCFLLILGNFGIISLVPFIHLLKFKYLKIEFISRLTGGATPHQTLKTNTVWWSILRRHPTNLHSNLFYFFLQNIYFLSSSFQQKFKNS